MATSIDKKGCVKKPTTITNCTLRDLRKFFTSYSSAKHVLVNGLSDIHIDFDKDGNIILSDNYMSSYPGAYDREKYLKNRRERRKQLINQLYSNSPERMSYIDTDGGFPFEVFPKKVRCRVFVDKIKEIQSRFGLTHEDTIKALMKKKKYRKAINAISKKTRKHPIPDLRTNMTIRFKMEPDGNVEKTVRKLEMKYKKYDITHVKEMGDNTIQVIMTLKDAYRKNRKIRW